VIRLAYISILLSAAIPACADSPEPIRPLEVRPSSGAPVERTAYACTDHPASVRTPCDPYANQQVPLRVWNPAGGEIELRLSANSDIEAVDGTGATAVLVLRFGIEVALVVEARQEISGMFSSTKQQPSDGWIEPVDRSATLDGRNTGRFSLTFDWGTISGAYDSYNAFVPLSTR